ncbi:MAG: SidE phosphodiesterase domain-containing protein [Endozoicomonas sp.]|uniref:SidE phosphodiesterase domain-containing protein n=1 Tax=Endozoicomonas sp. TaxID=1892382 RepID=UPI003D9BF96B
MNSVGSKDTGSPDLSAARSTPPPVVSEGSHVLPEPKTPLHHFSVSPVEPSVRLSSTVPKLLDANFYDDCQSLVERHLHTPQNTTPVSCGEIPRPLHGAQHLTRSACWIPVLIAWRQEAGDPEAIQLPKEHIPWLMKAALLHDSGREGEGKDLPAWEAKSAQHLENHLLASGCPSELASQLSEAVVNKNRTEDSGKARTNLFEKLLHDADCLEIIRCRKEFDIGYLDIYQEFKRDSRTLDNIVQLADQVRLLIRHQYDLGFNSSIILAHSNDSKKELKPEVSKCKDTLGKYPFEYADNALLCQVLCLKELCPELYRLLTKGLGEAPEIALGELKVQYYPKAIKAPLPNQIHDPQSNKTFSVTGGISPEAGAHRLLMNQLARAMGFETPDCKLYVHDRYECSVLEESLTSSPP